MRNHSSINSLFKQSRCQAVKQTINFSLTVLRLLTRSASDRMHSALLLMYLDVVVVCCIANEAKDSLKSEMSDQTQKFAGIHAHVKPSSNLGWIQFANVQISCVFLLFRLPSGYAKKRIWCWQSEHGQMYLCGRLHSASQSLTMKCP